MANFYKDNPDIQFHLDRIDFADIVEYREDGFADAAEYDYAPESFEDAIDNYRRVLDLTGEIAGEVVAPVSPDIDTDGSHLVPEAGRVRYAPGIAKALKALGQADLMGFTLPRRFGGLNAPGTVYAIATEIVSRADPSLMNIFGLQGIAETINMFASDDQKERTLPRFSRGEVTGAMVLTEPEAGSDLQNIQLQAYQTDGGEWRLRGVKRFITNGCGEVLLVLARSEADETGGMGLSLFLAENDETIQIRRTEDKMGIHGSPTCEMQFNDTPCELVGERRRGLVTYVMALMNGARIGIAAQSVGLAEAARREARNYAATRVQFGRSIDQMPAVADLLAEMNLAVETGRALLYEASLSADYEYGLAEMMERHPDRKRDLNKRQKQYKRLAGFLTPVAKYWCSEMCNRVAYDAISVLGGSGYMKDYILEQLYRDARITTIYEGTSQLQVLAAVRGVTSGTAEKEFARRDEIEPPRGFKGRAKKIRRAREKLADAVNYLKNDQSADYVDLWARPLVDTAIDIYLSYLWLDMARASKHKVPGAKRFITRALDRCDVNLKRLTRGDRSTLKHYDVLVGPVTEEE